MEPAEESPEGMDGAHTDEPQETVGSDYAGLGYSAEDLDNEPDTSQWIDRDTEDSFEHVVTGNAGRLVELQDSLTTSAGQTKPALRHDMSATEVRGTPSQPNRAAVSRRFFEGYVTVGGLRALTLIDTGTDTEMVSSAFAKVVGLKTFVLDTPVGLQMACVGSRSKINFGARASMAIGKQLLVKDKYFDVVNLERYDVILGLPFLWNAKAILDFSGEGKLTVFGTEFGLVSSEFAIPRTRQAGTDRKATTAAAMQLPRP